MVLHHQDTELQQVVTATHRQVTSAAIQHPANHNILKTLTAKDTQLLTNPNSVSSHQETTGILSSLGCHSIHSSLDRTNHTIILEVTKQTKQSGSVKLPSVTISI